MLNPNAAGLCLALLTALFWGALPLAVKQLLPVMDSVTIVCLRFCVAAVWIWILPDRSAPRPAAPLSRRDMGLLVLATLGLGANFVLFNTSVGYLSASACQILAQAGPMLLLMGGIFILREPFLPVQGVSVATLVAGLLLFFNVRLADLFSGGGDFAFGMMLGLTAALVWSIYGLAQKVLLRVTTPTRILRVIYPCCALGLLPASSPSAVLNLDFFQLCCLAFACVNTIVAYGSFTRAMNIWHSAKVSAVLTTTTLFTLALEYLGHAAFPAVFPLERLSLLSSLGALAVVLGALGIALGPMLHSPHLHLHERKRRNPERGPGR